MNKYYYIMILDNNLIDEKAPKLVYKIDDEKGTAYFDTHEKIRKMKEKPILFKSKSVAENYAKMLMFENIAIVAESFIELK